MTQGQSQVNLLTIKQFANVCHTTPRTLRIYERLGLLMPAFKNSENKYRYYSQKQALEFGKIKLLQSFDISLKDIQKASKMKLVDAILNQELGEMEENLKEKQKQFEFLQKMTSFYFDPSSTLSFEKETVGPFLLLCYMVPKGEYAKIGDYFTTLWKVARKNKLKCRSIDEMTFYYEGEYKPKDTKLEMAIICNEKKEDIKNLKLPEGMYFRTLPKLTANTYTYKGPYDFLPLIFQKLDAFAEETKMPVKNPVFEMYQKEPPTTKSKYDYITKIFYPISESK